MKLEEIEELSLLNLSKKYTAITKEEFSKIKDGFYSLQSQLDQLNKKLGEIKDIALNIREHGDYFELRSVKNDILSIIGKK